MQVKAELNPLVESNLWLSGAIDVAGILGLHSARLMVKHCLYHAISDCLCHNMLSILRAVDLQLSGNVGKCDSTVGKADCSHRSLNNIMMEANDEAVGEVCLELGGKLLHNTVKPSDIASLHSLGELKVGGQRMLHLLSHKGLTLRDVSKQQIHSDRQLGDMLFEPSSRILRSLPCRLKKVLVSLSVIQLEGLDPAQVVVVPCPLIVAGLFGKVDLRTNLSAWLYRL